MKKSWKNIMDMIEKNGYVSVKVNDPFHAQRRRMLYEMEQAGMIKLNLPVIGSYMHYNKK